MGCHLALSVALSAQSVDVAGVPHGTASVDENGALTTIHASDGTVIDYHRFGVAVGDTVRFVQPNATSRVLNRVIGSDPSAILGRLEANGVVYLVNPAGVIFGVDSVVDVAGLYAAAARISDADFLAGRDRFVDGVGRVEHAGTMHARDFAHLFGRTVVSTGTIHAPGGVVTLTSGRDVYLRELDGRVLVMVDQASSPVSESGALDPVGVSQSGSIEADQVAFTAGDVYSFAIRQSGEVRAPRGTVAVRGAGDVEIRGVVDVSSASGVGGQVAVLGETIALRGALVDATGETGGGTILIGGGPRGQRLDSSITGRGLPSSSITLLVDNASSIRADSRTDGRGGSIVLWSDRATLFAGSLRARGGSLGGDGGFAEVSSAGRLEFWGTVDLTAPHGELGTLLLDPEHIEIVLGGSLTIDDVDAFADPGSDPGVSRIDPATLDAVGATVTLEARDSITFTDPVSLSTDGAGLTARAGGSIAVNSSITTRGGPVTLIANDASSGAASGVGSIFVNAVVVTDAGGSGGDVVLTVDGGAGTITLGADLRSNGNVHFGGPLLLDGGATGSVRSVESAGTVVFEQTVDGDRSLFVRAPFGVTRFAGDVGSVQPLTGLTTDVGGGTRVGGSVSVGSSGIEIRDALTLESNVTLSTRGGGDLRLGSTVESDGTPRSLALLVLDGSGSAIAEVGTVALGGDVGAVSPLASLTVNGGGVSPRATIPAAATVVGENALTIRVIGDVTLGPREKLTVLGNLTIDAGGTVTVGDVSTLGSLTIDAAQIEIQRRAAGFVRDAADRVFVDGGVDVVVGGTIAFSVVPTLIGTGGDPRFATPTGGGDVVGTLSSFTVSSFGQLGLAQLIGNRGSVAGRTLDLGVFASTPEAGVTSVIAANTDSVGARVADTNWPGTRGVGFRIPPSAATQPRVRRHEWTSWIETTHVGP